MGIQVELVLMVSLETPMDHGLGASPSLQKMKVIKQARVCQTPLRSLRFPKTKTKSIF